MLGERGINLSGGQKQRLALARALAGRTAVIASHRVSAVRDANQVIVLHDGRVVERGTHASLISAGGRYSALLQRQQLEESLDGGSAEGASEPVATAVQGD